MARPVIPSLQEWRQGKLPREQLRTASYVLRAIALGRAPGEQALTRRAVLTRLLAALVLSVALWVYVENETNPVQTQAPFTLQVQPENLPSKAAIRNGGGIAQVTVAAQGLQSSLSSKGNLQAYIDLTGAPSSGEVVRPVLLRGGNAGVHYTITPATLTLFLEPQLQVSVPVVFNPLSTLPSNSNLSVGGTKLSSYTVLVQGPKEQVDQVKNAIVGAPLGTVTAPSPSTASFQISFPSLVPQLVDSTGRLIQNNNLTIKPNLIKATLTFNQLQIVRTLTVSPSFPCSAPTGLLVFPVADPPLVTVAGPPLSLGSLKVLTTDPVCPTSYAARTIRRSVPLQLPYGVTVVPTDTRMAGLDLLHPTWSVLFTIVKQTATTDLAAQVVLDHLGAGLRASADVRLVTVYVTGAYVDIAAIEQLHAHLDLAHLGPGTYALHPTVDMPRALPRYSSSPATVRVAIVAAGRAR